MTRSPSAPGMGVVSEIERSRVIALLDATPAPVVVVSAPAGSGKSVLMRQWLARGSRAHVTVSAGAHLDGAVPLSEAILDALETLGPLAPDTRVRLTAKEPAFSVSVLPALAHLVQTRNEPFVLVLDDVHLLQSAGAHQVLEAVCGACPDDSTIALLTRSLPPDWLARVRSTGRLAEISAADLDFDHDETASLFARMGIPVSGSDVATIVEHTEGWATGVYLTALSQRSGTGPPLHEVRVARGSDRIVADYLRTQVLAALSEDQRRFLTMTSVLEELNGPLCDAVLQRSDSASVLADLHRSTQFVIAVDDDERRFRYHHLLAEELSADLRTYEPTQIAGLHERACGWFDKRGDRDAAIRHATASGDVDLAASVIWPAVPACIASGNLDRLHYWLSGLTELQIASNPWLSMAAAWAALQQGDAAAMGRWARIAEAHATPQWREQASHDPYAATVAVLHALVGTGGLEGTRDLCELALLGLAPDDGLRAAAAFNRGIAQTLQRDLAGGQASMVEAEAAARSLGVPVIEANALSWMGLLALEAGDRDRGIRLISEGAEVTRRHHLDRLATAALSTTAQALVLALVGDKSAASATLATARRLSGLAGEIAPWFAVTGRVIQARTAILLGDGATARLLISEARQHMNPELQASSVADRLADVESVLELMADQGGAASVLTTTELRVLQFLPSHLTLQQIGQHLFISQSTVKTHVLSIYRKFGVNSRAEAVARATTLGLVEAPIGE